uniref:CCHC-type domain-containing protein n=1 Tax=Tanacetum cinerariifolium TaxID=118510 RepID=A0A6L2MIF9_TANCI|nr:hypothetical protein [Tanacetum cinerariifolium]
MQKLESELWNHAIVEAGHAAYNDRFYELARLVPRLVTLESRKIERYVYGLALQICGMVRAIELKTIQKAVQISDALTDEAVRNGSIKKVEKRGNMGESSKDNSGRDDNKRTKTQNVFATTINPVKRENTGTWPKCTTCNSYHAPGGPCRICFNCNYLGHLAKDCRGIPKNVNPVMARNPPVRACYKCGSTDHCRGNQGNQARGRAFMLGAEEARQDPNIMTRRIEPSELGFRYEIEIASGKLVEIDKVIKNWKIEIEGHVFDIDLIPFEHGSFDVIIGMDWLCNHKAEIICHEKVVRIPLLDGEVLRVLGERPEEKLRVHEDDILKTAFRTCYGHFKFTVMSFDDILIYSKTHEEHVENLWHVINGNGIHVDPSKIEAVKNWKAPKTPSEVHLFLGLAGYYRTFIENFSKIAKSLTILTQKCKTFDWGKEQKLAFQTLMDKLCNAPVLALLDGPKDFVVYYDASRIGLGCVLSKETLSVWDKECHLDHKSLHRIFCQKDLNMRQRRWIDLFSDYDCEIRYLLGKANMVADSLSRKERVKPTRVRAMNMTFQSSIEDSILSAQKEAVDESVGLQKGLDEIIEQRGDRNLYYLDRIWVPLRGNVKTQIIDEAHKSKYSIHPGADKMYYDLIDRTSSGHDTILVIMDRLMKSAYFLPMREDYKIDRLARIYLNEIVSRHGTDGQSEHAIQTLEEMLKVCFMCFEGGYDVHLSLVEFSYNNSYHSSVRCALFEALYGRKCHSLIMWAEVGEGVVRFGKKGKLAPRFVVPFKIIEKVGPVAYRLDFPEELNGVNDTFHVSNLKKCLADPTLQVPLDEIRVYAKLNFVEEPVEILDREYKKFKRSRNAIIKVRWNSKHGPEFTWEHEDQMKLKYPYLFSDISG